MAYLGNIVSHIEEKLSVNLRGKYHTRSEIDGICFLTSSNYNTLSLEKNILYLTEDAGLIEIIDQEVDDSGSTASINKLLPNLIAVNIQKASRFEKLLYVEEPVNLMDVFNTIQEDLLKSHAVKLQREELFRALHSDVGLKGLADVAHDFLKNPISICDSSFTLLAASPTLTDERNLIQKNGRLYVKDQYFQDMEDRHIIEHIYSSTTPYLTTVAELNYKFVFESIRINHSVVGYVCVRGTVRDFTEDDLEFIDAFSKMLSIEMQKDDSFSRPTGLKYEYFLTSLLDGHFERSDYILKHFEQLGRSEMSFYHLIILDSKEQISKSQKAKTLYDQILTIFPNSMVATFHGRITVLLPAETAKPFTEPLEKRFLTFLQLNHLQAFVSYPYKEIDKSSIYYRQVDDLCNFYPTLEHGKASSIVYYEAYFLEQSFFQCKDPALLYASIHPDIIELMENSKNSKNDYLHTLKVYLRHNRNAVEATKELHIHKSTFFYRLSKMEDLFGIDINNMEKLFAYDYSFRVLDYLSIKA